MKNGILFFCCIFLGAFAAIGCIVWSVKGHLKNKKANIAVGIVLGFLLINVVALWMIKKDEQKEIEETVVSEVVSKVEQRIDEFKQENTEDILKYEITIDEIDDRAVVKVVYNIDTTQEPEIIGGYKFYSHNYYALFPSLFLESVKIGVDTYGEVYVNGELIHTEKKKTYGSSNNDSKKCAVCGKSYSSGGSSNMCSQCYKNYKYASDAAGY